MRTANVSCDLQSFNVIMLSRTAAAAVAAAAAAAKDAASAATRRSHLRRSTNAASASHRRHRRHRHCCCLPQPCRRSIDGLRLAAPLPQWARARAASPAHGDELTVPESARSIDAEVGQPAFGADSSDLLQVVWYACGDRRRLQPQPWRFFCSVLLQTFASKRHILPYLNYCLLVPRCRPAECILRSSLRVPLSSGGCTRGKCGHSSLLLRAGARAGARAAALDRSIRGALADAAARSPPRSP